MIGATPGETARGMADGSAPGAAFSLREHPSRRVLAGEVHARPYETLYAPARVSHLAVVHGEGGEAAAAAHLVRLFAEHGAEPPGTGAIQFSRDLGALRFRFERHTEFSTYTFARGDMLDPGGQPFDVPALALVSRGWLESLPGQVIAAVHLVLERETRDPDQTMALFGGNALVGSRVTGGAAEIWTDFRLHADGFSRVLVRDMALSPSQAGRLVQRLLEIETYRLMALLAFPLARNANAEVVRIDRDLAGIIAALANPKSEDQDRPLLDRLTGLAAEAERVDAATGNRLSAARAYYAIMLQRIAELREERILGVQTVGEFMDRRLAPAMKTCENAVERQQRLAGRVSRTSGLLRTRVDIALEERNTDLLKSMSRRAKLQLRLQETVEGLSVVAISYYLMGLVGDAAKGLTAAGVPVESDLASLISLPVILGAVILGLRRLRRAVGHGGGE